MNRREVLHGFAALSINGVIRGMGGVPFGSGEGQNLATGQSGTEVLPSVVAGVRLIDSEIARLATELCRSASPPYLFNYTGSEHSCSGR